MQPLTASDVGIEKWMICAATRTRRPGHWQVTDPTESAVRDLRETLGFRANVEPEGSRADCAPTESRRYETESEVRGERTTRAGSARDSEMP